MDFNRNLRIVRTSGPSYPFPYKSNVLWVHHDENNNPVVEIWDHGKWSPVTGVRSDSGDVIIDTEMSDSSSNAIANKTVKKYVDGIASKTDASILYLNEEVAVLQSLIDILNSDSNVDGSVKKTVADAVARVVAGAPEDLDTLKEIADYIASDKTGAAQMAAAISQLQTLTEKHTSDIAGNASGVAENKAGVAALKTLTAGHTKSIEDLRIAKQDALVSGTNIKTINGVPVLGAGDIQTPAPTKVSELENDKGFLTEHQSLEAYYQKAAAQLDNRVVAEAIVSLASRLDALEGSRGLLGDATAGTVDVRGLTRCRYPLVMLGHGVPAEANVPVNLPEGLPWDGVPAFAGQQYINLDAASGGLYYAAGVDSVSDWKQA